jgi:hypothetical protein
MFTKKTSTAKPVQPVKIETVEPKVPTTQPIKKKNLFDDDDDDDTFTKPKNKEPTKVSQPLPVK